MINFRNQTEFDIMIYSKKKKQRGESKLVCICYLLCVYDLEFGHKTRHAYLIRELMHNFTFHLFHRKFHVNLR